MYGRSQCPLEHCMLSDDVVEGIGLLAAIWSQCPLEHCMLSDGRFSAHVPHRRGVSQCPLEHCMLSDPKKMCGKNQSTKSLNALSSIVCFLTLYINQADKKEAYLSLNALSSIVCFLTHESRFETTSKGI